MIPRPGVNATAAGHVGGTRTDAGEVILSCPKTPQRPGVGIAAASPSYPGIAEARLSRPLAPQRPGIGTVLEAELAANAETSTRLVAITSAVRIADQ